MRQWRNGVTFLEAMIIVGLIGLLAATAIPLYTKARDLRQKRACIANLERILAAKKAAAEELGITEGKVDKDTVEVHLKASGGIPVCPTGGKYAYGSLDQDPKCSVLGHALP